MKNPSANKIRFWSEIALSIVSVAVGILFITQVADIYYSAKAGADMYSRAIVWGKLKILIAPFVVWALGVIACFVLSVLYPTAENNKRTFTAQSRVARIRKKLPKGEGEEYEAARRDYKNLELGRYIIYGAASAFAVATAIITIVYLADHSHFSSGDISGDVLGLVKNVFPWIIASFLLFVGAVVYEWAVASRELKSMTKILTLCKGMPVSRSPLVAKIEAARAALVKNEEYIVWGVRAAIFIVAVVFIGLGIWNGGANDVLNKAINICTECIGLG